ncbi:LysR family transcriptional regulator, partial [Rhodococcus koreensis]
MSIPVVAELAHTHAQVDVVISEFEPVEAFALLADDELDLALTYDYNLAPATTWRRLQPGAGYNLAPATTWRRRNPAPATTWRRLQPGAGYNLAP